MALFVLFAIAGVYLVLGVCFAAAFVTIGVSRIDSAANGGSIAFRLVITPGVVALWPFLATRWCRAGSQER